MDAIDKQLWIEKRYGPIKFHRITLYVASVPLYGGKSAEGDGLSENTAVESLYNDLAPESTVDQIPEPARKQ